MTCYTVPWFPGMKSQMPGCMVLMVKWVPEIVGAIKRIGAGSPAFRDVVTLMEQAGMPRKHAAATVSVALTLGVLDMRVDGPRN